MPQTAFRPNHMHIAWHDYTSHDATLPISAAPLREKASVIGRTGLMLLSCGTGAWRVRSSMNTLAEELGLVCAADIGLTSIEYTCFDGEQAFFANAHADQHRRQHLKAQPTRAVRR